MPTGKCYFYRFEVCYYTYFGPPCVSTSSVNVSLGFTARNTCTPYHIVPRKNTWHLMINRACVRREEAKQESGVAEMTSKK